MAKENTAKKQEPQEGKARKGALKLVLDPAFKVDKQQVPRLIPFILYLTFWAILYIANTHYAERTQININKMSKELKELRADYLTIKADLMFRSKQSEVAKMVAPQGIKELKEPPQKIYVETE